MDEKAVEIVREYLLTVEANFNAFGVIPRLMSKFPFDHVALELAAKAHSLAKACLVLIEAGHEGEAYGLCRSVTECALTLRHLTSDSAKQWQRSRDFVEYSYHYKNFWLHHLRERFPDGPRAAAIEEEVRRWNLTGNAETVLNWAKINTWKIALLEHPLDWTEKNEPIPREQKVLQYAINYFQPSQYVHCSQPALDGFFTGEGAPFAFAPSKALLPDVAGRVGTILIVQTYLVVRYALYGMNIAPPDYLGEALGKAFFGLQGAKNPTDNGPDQDGASAAVL